MHNHNSKVPQTLIFVHIPKTAGRTLEAVLERQYKSKEIYNIYGDGGMALNAAKNLSRLPPQAKRRLKLIKGHHPFGVHFTLPQPAHYITFLRNPIARVISHYEYIKSHDHPLRDLVLGTNMSLKEYVSSGISLELANGQTRLISGQDKAVPFGKGNNALLTLAKKNIDRYFVVVGLVERFDESLILMKLQFGWKSAAYVRLNTGRKKTKKSQLDSETLETIKKYNNLDLQLYNYVSQRLSQQIAAQKSVFEPELQNLQKQKRYYPVIGIPRHYTQRVLRKVKRYFFSMISNCYK